MIKADKYKAQQQHMYADELEKFSIFKSAYLATV